MVILPSAPMSPLCEHVIHIVLELGIMRRGGGRSHGGFDVIVVVPLARIHDLPQKCLGLGRGQADKSS